MKSTQPGVLSLKPDQLYLLWTRWLVTSTLELFLAVQTHLVLQRLLRNAQYRCRDGRHLATLDKLERLKIEFQYVPCPWF